MVRAGSYAAVNLALIRLILKEASWEWSSRLLDVLALPCGYVLLILCTVQKLLFLKLCMCCVLGAHYLIGNPPTFNSKLGLIP